MTLAAYCTSLTRGLTGNMRPSLVVAVTDLRSRLVSDLDALIDTALRDDKTELRNQFALRLKGEEIITWSEALYDEPERRQADVAHNGFERRGPFAVVFGDINDFKAFNSRHGHDRADFAIVEAGRQLKQIADSCKGEAFRRSGDEFVLLLPEAHLLDLGQHLLEVFTRCQVEIEESLDHFGMSFGFSVVEKTSTFEDLLKRAEVACEAAKRSGAGSLVGWTAELEAQLPRAYRRRCADCKSVISLLIPPGVSGDSPNYPCPVCVVQMPSEPAGRRAGSIEWSDRHTSPEVSRGPSDGEQQTQEVGAPHTCTVVDGAHDVETADALARHAAS